jgi:PAS domain S-box-containing protein
MTNEQVLLNAATMRWINDLAAQGILTTDAELKIRGWNHWLELHSGRSAEEMLGRDLFEAYPELIERHLERYYRDALEGQVGLLSQRLHGYLLPMPPDFDGTAFTHMQQSARIAPLLQDGKVIGTITVIDDVTERVAHVAELQDQIAALEALHDIGRAILSLDLAECLQRLVNQTSALASAEMAAVVLRQGEGLTVAACAGCEIALSELQIAAPDNIAARVVQSGQALSVMELDASTLVTTLHPNHCCVAAAPLVADSGVIGALVIESSRPHAFSPADQAQLSRLATLAAIAIENARLYGSLHESEQLLSTMLRSIGDAVIAADSNGTVTFINPVAQALTGWAQEEAASQPLEVIFDIVDEETRQRTESLATRVIREGVTIRLDSPSALIARDGTERPIDGSGAPIKEGEGRVGGVVLVFRDITEHRQIEQAREELFRSEKAARAQAEQANRVKDEFLATVSHELRTPLNSMLGWVRILRSRTPSDDYAARALETIERSARLQNQLIEDLMDVSRIMNGKLRLDVRPVHLSPTIEAALDVMRPAAEAKEIELQVDLDPTVGEVYCDPSRMQQVVWNLLSNAVKFTPKGGRVRLRLEKVNSHARITVSDTGKGISPKFLPHVFERFSQADGSTQRAHSGLGLGLAIVRHLMELQGGTAHADSSGEGQGATFTIELPLSPIKPAAPDSNRVNFVVDKMFASEHAISLEGVRVLVVDDESDARELLTVILGQCSAQVTAVSAGAEALAVLAGGIEGKLPDVIVSDIGMAGEDGYALIRKVRALAPENGGRIPAIALTGYARAEDRVRALAEGFQTHVPKPVESVELITVIASLTGRLVTKQNGGK